VGLRSVHASLQRAVERARQAGVSQLPAIQIGAEVFAGADALEQATAALLAAAGQAT
jgi:2-hydroxychromene-2-carboxylate isomerase